MRFRDGVMTVPVGAQKPQGAEVGGSRRKVGSLQNRGKRKDNTRSQVKGIPSRHCSCKRLRVPHLFGLRAFVGLAYNPLKADSRFGPVPTGP